MIFLFDKAHLSHYISFQQYKPLRLRINNLAKAHFAGLIIISVITEDEYV